MECLIYGDHNYGARRAPRFGVPMVKTISFIALRKILKEQII